MNRVNGKRGAWWLEFNIARITDLIFSEAICESVVALLFPHNPIAGIGDGKSGMEENV
jgi:hypothetical protein